MIFPLVAMLFMCCGWNVVFAGLPYNVPGNDDDKVTYTGFFGKTPMPFARSDMKADLIDNRLFSDYTTRGPRIFLIGGCIANQTCNMMCAGGQCNFNCVCPLITNKCTYYTPETGEWFNCAPAPVNRYMHATVVINNKLYLTGGRDINSNLITQTDVYDPLANSWSTPPMLIWPNATCDHQAFAVGNSMYVVGGYDLYWNTPGTLMSVDVTTGIWNKKLAPMNVPRGDIRVAGGGSRGVYVMGGFQSPNFCAPTNVVERYNVITNTWSLATPMQVPRGDVSVGVLGKYIFAIGGETINPTCAYSVPVRNVTRYNSLIDKWVFEGQIPDNLFRFASASYNSSNVLTRAVYLFGGQGKFIMINSSFGYYPIKNGAIQYIPSILYPINIANGPPPLSQGGIAGLVIACLVFVGGCCCCVFFIIGYRRRYHKQTNKQLIHLWSIYLITLLVILSLYIMAIAHLSTYPSINLPNHNS